MRKSWPVLVGIVALALGACGDTTVEGGFVVPTGKFVLRNQATKGEILSIFTKWGDGGVWLGGSFHEPLEPGESGSIREYDGDYDVMIRVREAKTGGGYDFYRAYYNHQTVTKNKETELIYNDNTEKTEEEP